MTRTKATARFSKFGGGAKSEKPSYRAARKSVPPDVRSFWVSAAESFEFQMSAASGKKQSPISATHPPPTQEMLDASIKNLNEGGYFSVLAIKKYISAVYKCNAQKLVPFIKQYLKEAVASGKLIQATGTGASGSFKMSENVVVKQQAKAARVAAPKNRVRASGRSANAKISNDAKKTARRG